MKTTKIIIAIACFLAITTSAGTLDTYQYVLPLRNYQHWSKLVEVCEKKDTYGANEHIKNGMVCQWVIVPYWPKVPPK